MTDSAPHPFRISTVAFFNATPLTYGLETDPAVRIRHAVPSGLLAHLQNGSADVALLPVIDYQRLTDAVVVPVGAIGCDGPTLTVRLYADRPIERTTVLAVDGDSHTSVALARIILQHRFGIRPHVVPLTDAPRGATRLLIGDKVITAAPDLPVQIDLGQAWKELTGLPFVFAIWTARQGVGLYDIPAKLAAAREQGLRHIETLVREQAIPRGWPAGVARQYLTDYLKFRVGPRELEAIRTYHAMSAELGLVENPPQALRIAGAFSRSGQEPLTQ